MDGELWASLYSWIQLVDKEHLQDPRKGHRDAAVVAAYEFAVLHDRPVCWACDERHWAGVPQGQRPFRAELAEAMDSSLCIAAVLMLGLIDGKALAIPRHSTDPDADFGRGAGAV